MNAPQKVTSWLVAPGVALVRPAPRVDTRARKQAGARWLRAMRSRGPKNHVKV